MYPEIVAGGFSRVDGTIEFFTRVNALLRPEMTVLDFGAGRGEWASDPVEYRRHLQDLRGKCAVVIGADIDDIVRDNPSVDKALVCSSDGRIPLEDSCVDLIVSDHTFEHVEKPMVIGEEFFRVLKPGGWVCARTPNKWGYIAVTARLIPNLGHIAVVRRAQPGRKSIDVFPTCYRLNTRHDLATAFTGDKFEDFTYYWAGDPGYYGGSRSLARTIRLSTRLAPHVLWPKIFVFLRKRRDVVD